MAKLTIVLITKHSIVLDPGDEAHDVVFERITQQLIKGTGVVLASDADYEGIVHVVPVAAIVDFVFEAP